MFFTLLWFYAAADYRLIDRSVDPYLLRAMTRRYVLGMLAYILAFALAFVSPAASLTLIWRSSSSSPSSSSCRNRTVREEPGAAPSEGERRG